MADIYIAVGAGIALGWIARGLLDRAVMTIAVRVLTIAIGKEKVAEAFAKVAAKANDNG